MKKKITVAVAALALVLCVAVGGTLAYLIDGPKTVKNTFTYGDINIDLTESDALNLKMIPGSEIFKDPKVTVKAGSEACWLFVKVEKSPSYDSYLNNYEMAEGWEQLKGKDGAAVEGVYFRSVDKNTAYAGTEYQVLKDNKVTVKTDVTKSMMNDIDGIKYDEDGNETTTEDAAELALRPTLTFTAYAIQKDGFANVTDAWTEINK